MSSSTPTNQDVVRPIARRPSSSMSPGKSERNVTKKDITALERIPEASDGFGSTASPTGGSEDHFSSTLSSPFLLDQGGTLHGTPFRMPQKKRKLRMDGSSYASSSCNSSPSATRTRSHDGKDEEDIDLTDLQRLVASCWKYYPHSTALLPKEYYKLQKFIENNIDGSNQKCTTTLAPDWLEITKLPPTSGPYIYADEVPMSVSTGNEDLSTPSKTGNIKGSKDLVEDEMLMDEPCCNNFSTENSKTYTRFPSTPSSEAITANVPEPSNFSDEIAKTSLSNIISNPSKAVSSILSPALARLTTRDPDYTTEETTPHVSNKSISRSAFKSMIPEDNSVVLSIQDEISIPEVTTPHMFEVGDPLQYDTTSPDNVLFPRRRKMKHPSDYRQNKPPSGFGDDPTQRLKSIAFGRPFAMTDMDEISNLHHSSDDGDDSNDLEIETLLKFASEGGRNGNKNVATSITPSPNPFTLASGKKITESLDSTSKQLKADPTLIKNSKTHRKALLSMKYCESHENEVLHESGEMSSKRCLIDRLRAINHVPHPGAPVFQHFHGGIVALQSDAESGQNILINSRSGQEPQQMKVNSRLNANLCSLQTSKALRTPIGKRIFFEDQPAFKSIAEVETTSPGRCKEYEVVLPGFIDSTSKSDPLTVEDVMKHLVFPTPQTTPDSPAECHYVDVLEEEMLERHVDEQKKYEKLNSEHLGGLKPNAQRKIRWFDNDNYTSSKSKETKAEIFNPSRNRALHRDKLERGTNRSLGVFFPVVDCALQRESNDAGFCEISWHHSPSSSIENIPHKVKKSATDRKTKSSLVRDIQAARWVHAVEQGKQHRQSLFSPFRAPRQTVRVAKRSTIDPTSGPRPREQISEYKPAGGQNVTAQLAKNSL